MKKLIALEEYGMFVLSIIGFGQLDYAWWYYPALILLPDLSMLGYIFGTTAGAVTYNIVHHKLTGVLVFAAGLFCASPVWMLSGIILFGHSSMDRMFGYGLKYTNAFTNTHLGLIGKNKKNGVI